jgi:hypothetical protein
MTDDLRAVASTSFVLPFDLALVRWSVVCRLQREFDGF